MVSQAFCFQSVSSSNHSGYLRVSTSFSEQRYCALAYDGSNAFTVMFFSYCREFDLSTMNFYTVKLAPTAATLTVIFSYNLREEENLFMITTHDANNGSDIVSRRVYHAMWYKTYLKALKKCTHAVEAHWRIRLLYSKQAYGQKR